MRRILNTIMLCAATSCLAGCQDRHRERPLYWHEVQHRTAHPDAAPVGRPAAQAAGQSVISK
ncbi:hypothetical protein LV478_12840 [Komagataeibacter oboediens]|uniref:hypothetical protein n=1 Tax=Komagataeibacter oboediens TaxID=65958 RepID=UPI0023DB91A5|nr:hypothetical protein [Komagataeibacter oboediens]WEQ51407.1 hypothetical protein LV478_12840 [Komagataeibacter oboediens]